MDSPPTLQTLPFDQAPPIRGAFFWLAGDHMSAVVDRGKIARFGASAGITGAGLGNSPERSALDDSCARVYPREIIATEVCALRLAQLRKAWGKWRDVLRHRSIIVRLGDGRTRGT